MYPQEVDDMIVRGTQNRIFEVVPAVMGTACVVAVSIQDRLDVADRRTVPR